MVTAVKATQAMGIHTESENRHAWMSYMVDKPPTEDPLLMAGVRPWELPEHRPTLTATRAAYKPYSTLVKIQDQGSETGRTKLIENFSRVRPKLDPWMPVATPRS